MKIEEIEKEPMPWLLPKSLTAENQRFELDMIQKILISTNEFLYLE
jgi:hypothetical protein